jgi:mannosyltransferase OCH1-like enzyme
MWDTMFPKVIYFCNKNIDSNTVYNSYQWKLLNPEYEIALFNDELCSQFLEKYFGKLHYNIFKSIPDGPIRADFWRVCILYINGGVYSDIDNQPLVSIDSFLENDVDFVICSSFWDSMNFSFNPNFIISNPGNTILKNCIDWYVQKYINQEKYDYWGWSVMRAFSDTLYLKDYKKEYGIYYRNEDGMPVQIIKECPGLNYNHRDAHNIYNNVRIFNNRTDNWDYNTHSFIVT